MRRPVTRVFTFACALTVMSCTSLLANAPSGSFDVGGSSATIGQTFLNFDCVPGILNAPQPCPAGTGNFNVTVPVSGDFATYLGEGGYVKNLSEATTPLNTSFLLSNWLTFFTGPVATPDLALDLRFIDLGIDPHASCLTAPAPGQLCTPIVPALVGSPNDPLGLSSFNLQNLNGGGSSASFTVSGTVRRISTGETSPFNGTFTASLDVPYQTALKQILAGQPFSHAYSATFKLQTVPEPKPTLAVMFGCLLVLSAARYRRKRIQS